jgi:hypothetical protein
MARSSIVQIRGADVNGVPVRQSLTASTIESPANPTVLPRKNDRVARQSDPACRQARLKWAAIVSCLPGRTVGLATHRIVLPGKRIRRNPKKVQGNFALTETVGLVRRHPNSHLFLIAPEGLQEIAQLWGGVGRLEITALHRTRRHREETLPTLVAPPKRPRHQGHLPPPIPLVLLLDARPHDPS